MNKIKNIQQLLAWAFIKETPRGKYIRISTLVVILVITSIAFTDNNSSASRVNELKKEYDKKLDKMEQKKKEFDDRLEAFDQRMEVRKDKMDKAFDNMHAGWEAIQLSREQKKIRQQIDQEELVEQARIANENHLEFLKGELSITFDEFAKKVEKGLYITWPGVITEYERWIDNYEYAFNNTIIGCAASIKDSIHRYRKDAIAARRMKQKIEEDLKSGNFNQHEIEGKKRYLKTLTEDVLSTDEKYLYEMSIRNHSNCIAKVKILLPYIEKYSPFLYDGRTFNHLTLGSKTPLDSHLRFALGLTNKQIIDKVKYLLQIDTPDLENENAKNYNVEMNKGKAGRLKELYHSLELDKKNCKKGKLFFCPIKVTDENRASLR
jgi:hypothetical protein